MRMMEVFILKFQSITEFQIPEIFNKWYALRECTIINLAHAGARLQVKKFVNRKL